MFCKNCGAQIGDDSAFCENCGAPVAAAQKAAAPAPAPAPSAAPKAAKQNKPKKKKTGLIVLLVIIGAILIAAGVYVATMFPLKVSADTAAALTTTTGNMKNFPITIKSNQPILSVKYAVDPVKPKDLASYSDAKLNFGVGSRKAVIDKLPIIPGDNELRIYVKTLFGSEFTEMTVKWDIGFVSAPEEAAMIELREGVKLVSNELIVIFSDNATDNEIEELVKDNDGEVVGRIYALGEYQIRFEGKGEDYIRDVRNRLMAEVIVDDVFYNLSYEEYEGLYPNDSLYDDWSTSTPDGNNWGLEAIDAPGAWEYNSRIGVTKVGVIDTWLQYDHPDLNIPLRHTYVLPTDDFKTMKEVHDYVDGFNEGRLTGDDYYSYRGMRDHGTHCTGIIGAEGNNEEGISGVYWNADMYFATWWYLYKSSDGLGASSTYESMIYNITRMVSSGCRVISMSVGSAYPSEPDDYERSVAKRFENMIISLENAGYDFLLIKAAGNENDDASNYALNRIMTDGEHAREHVVIVGSAEAGYSVEDRLEEWGTETYKFYDMAPYSNYGELIDVCAPGSDILSTIAGNEYEPLSGTSMATPMVAGVAGLVYGANPDLTYKDVKTILMTAHRNYCVHELEAYVLVNARLAVEMALERGEIPPYEEPQIGFVTGIVQDAKTLEIIPKAAVLATNMDTGVSYEAKVTDGMYSLSLEPGLYKMTFAARGYITETVYKIQITAGTVQYNMLLNMIKKETGKGVASGRILDAFDASPVGGARISVFRGLNNTSGTAIATTTANASGEYSVELEPGNYTIYASSDGYMNGAANIVVVSGQTRGQQDCTLTPYLNEGEVRIILTWSESPADLDSHLIIDTVDEYEEPLRISHIYWDNKSYEKDGVRYCNLDVDDRNSYGPETTSIYLAIDGATYYFFVHDYTNKTSTYSKGLAMSGAQVKVYVSGREEPYVFNVPNADGTLWLVFYIQDGEIFPVNELSYHDTSRTVGEA